MHLISQKIQNICIIIRAIYVPLALNGVPSISPFLWIRIVLDLLQQDGVPRLWTAERTVWSSVPVLSMASGVGIPRCQCPGIYSQFFVAAAQYRRRSEETGAARIPLRQAASSCSCRSVFSPPRCLQLTPRLCGTN